METDEAVNVGETDRFWTWFVVTCTVISVVSIAWSLQYFLFFFSVLSLINDFAV